MSANRTRQNRFLDCAKPFPFGFLAGSFDTSRVLALTAQIFSLDFNLLGCGWRRYDWLRRWFFLFTHPAFHADLTIDRVCFREPVINRRAQGMQRDFSLSIPFRTGNLRAIEPARTPQPNSLGAKVHRGLHGFFHCAAISNPPLDL